MGALRWASLAAAAVASASLASPEDTVIRPGIEWLDTSGARIYAGGGNLYLEQGTYYWVGEGRKGWMDLSSEFNLYSSPDLGTWTHAGAVLKNTSVLSPLQGPIRMERPKLFKCPGTGRHTLWFHCDLSDFSLKSVGVATADSVEGPYTMTSPCFRPDGADSYDMGIYVDDTGAYLVRSVYNEFAGISRLNDDCTNTTGIISKGPRIEGQAIMRTADGTYYMFGSHLTGWAPNPASFNVADRKTLDGAVWQDLGNPSGSATTFDSQSTSIFPYKHQDGRTTYMLMADRWNAEGPGGLLNATYVWLPLVQGGDGTWSLSYHDAWSLSATAGQAPLVA